MSESRVRFGTSGWRAIIAEDFTFERVGLVVEAIASYLRREPGVGKVIVGYDTRFLAEEFAALAARRLADHGFEVLLCTEPVPTPAIAYAILAEGARGALNFTASHNPPLWQGIKFSTATGAPALPEVTRQIEQEIERLETGGSPLPRSPGHGRILDYSPRAGYLRDLAAKIDYAAIARAHLRVAVDPLWGTARRYLDEALREAGAEVIVVHDHRDVLFGGGAPEPSVERLRELALCVRDNACHLGVATDGDADRFGIVDREGEFISPNQLIALLFDYLCETRPWSGGVARSVATSHQVDRVARRRQRVVYETPVGFKYIGQLIQEGKIVLGGEESAGLSIHGHYPEKDGILACLLAVEAVARTGASMTSLLDQLYQRDGRLVTRRIEIGLDKQREQRLREKLSRSLPEDLGGRRIVTIDRTDGIKFVFENESWVLLRISGTEPVARCYAEATSEAELEVLLEHGRRFALE